MAIQAMAAVDTTVSQAACYKMSTWVGSQGQPIFLKEKEMFTGYYYPFYRSFANPQPWGFQGYGGYGFNNNYGTSIIGSAIANQGMNVIGAGAIGGTQIATPTAIW